MIEGLKKVKGRFWTRESEMVEEIERETDYDVLGVFYDYMNVIDRTGDDDIEEEIELVRAGNTIAIR